jgi:hypothetical protein
MIKFVKPESAGEVLGQISCRKNKEEHFADVICDFNAIQACP